MFSLKTGYRLSAQRHTSIHFNVHDWYYYVVLIFGEIDADLPISGSFVSIQSSIGVEVSAFKIIETSSIVVVQWGSSFYTIHPINNKSLFILQDTCRKVP